MNVSDDEFGRKVNQALSTGLDEFYKVFAKSVLRWQDVEENLFLLYSELMRHPDPRYVSASFYAVVSLSARLQMIDAVTTLAIDDDKILGRWKKLYEKIRDDSRKRNKLAHYSMTGLITRDGDVSLTLMQSTHAVSATAKNEYDVRQVAQFGDSFKVLSSEIHEYTCVVEIHLIGRR